MAKKFDIVVSSPETGQGATLSVVLAKLESLHRIFQDVESAILRPGSARVRLPAGIGDSAALRVLGASPKRSLAIELQTPEIREDSFGDYAASLAQAEPKFIDTMVSASRFDAARMTILFPEKVDLFRVLRHVQQFSAGPGEAPCIVDGLVDSGELFFRHDVREWAEKTLPSIAPESISIRGLVRSGRLGNTPSFQIYDGNRSILIDPNAEAIPSLKRLFGQVVEVAGTAQYNKVGIIQKVSDINSVERYSVLEREIKIGDRIIRLSLPIRYEITTDDRGTEFITESSDLDIHAYGTSLTEAISAANEEFLAIWDSIGKVPEDEIHESALPLRARLLARIIHESAAVAR